MQKIGDLVAKIGEYNDQQTGEKKNRWKGCGSLFQREDGSQVVKLDVIPVGFSGWLSVFDPKPVQNQAPARQNTAPTRTESPPAAPSPAPVTHGDFNDDDLPF